MRVPLEFAYRRFSRFAWGVLGYNVLVVLWGAYVRATGSGAGCGSHWPLCNGEVVPRAPQIETMIEFTHRVTSGLALLAVVALWIWSLRLFPPGHRARLAASLALVFIVVEAALGAGLVLFELVAQNASFARAAYLAGHLANTQVLLAMLAMTAWLASRPGELRPWRERPKALLAALPVALLVSVTGAVAALGDTLFPAAAASGVQHELSGAAHGLLRLRLLHPVVAMLAGPYLILAALWAIRLQPRLRPPALAATLLVLVQLAAGGVNVLLLAPVWMQIVHLFLADLLWIALVILAAEAAVSTPEPRPAAAGRATLEMR